MSQFDRQNIQNNPEKAPAVRQAGEHLGFGCIMVLSPKSEYNTRAGTLAL